MTTELSAEQRSLIEAFCELGTDYPISSAAMRALLAAYDAQRLELAAQLRSRRQAELEREVAEAKMDRNAHLQRAERALVERDAATARAEAAEKDAERLDWYEAQHTLHYGLEVEYVVDGYDLCLLHEDGVTEVWRTHGDTLRAAIDAALAGCGAEGGGA